MKHLIWLGGLTLVALMTLDTALSERHALLNILFWLPFVIAGSAIFVSVFLNRFQPILILMTLMLLNGAVYYFMPAGSQDLTAMTLFPLVSFLFPLSMLLWILLPEKGLQNKRSVLLQMGLLVGPVIGIFAVMTTMPLHLLQWLLVPVETLNLNMTLPALVMFVVVAGLIVFRSAVIRHSKVLDLALLFVLLLTAIGLNQSYQAGAIAWLSSFAALMILFSLVFDAHHLAYTDALTGLKGRRALEESFLGLGRRYSIAMMDIDHFKSFNDRYGHEVGDQVLQEVADVLNHISIGKVFRYGGEEFTVLFKNKSADQVVTAIETIRQRIADLVLKVPQKERITETKVTVSFGVAEKTPALKTPEAVMKAADDALYQAKKAGRNQTMIWQ